MILGPFWSPKWCLGADGILCGALPEHPWGALGLVFWFFDSSGVPKGPSGVPKGGQDEPKVAKRVPKWGFEVSKLSKSRPKKLQD